MSSGSFNLTELLRITVLWREHWRGNKFSTVKPPQTIMILPSHQCSLHSTVVQSRLNNPVMLWMNLIVSVVSGILEWFRRIESHRTHLNNQNVQWPLSSTCRVVQSGAIQLNLPEPLWICLIVGVHIRSGSGLTVPNVGRGSSLSKRKAPERELKRVKDMGFK